MFGALDACSRGPSVEICTSRLCLWNFGTYPKLHAYKAAYFFIISLYFLSLNIIYSQGADSMGHVEARALPHFYKWLETGGTVSRRTANNKRTKLYWPSQQRSAKRLIVLLKPKSGGARPKKPPPHFCSGLVPPTVKFVPAPLFTVLKNVFSVLQVSACQSVSITAKP